jgi:hypothetical protein
VNRPVAYSSNARRTNGARSGSAIRLLPIARGAFRYAYGPLELFEQALTSSGAHVGEPAALGTHVHHYHAVWDDMERRILRRFDWQVSPLRPSDVQFDPERDRSQ